ncbi:hypothetical protein ACLOJK_006266 [Asimina triloba]
MVVGRLESVAKGCCDVGLNGWIERMMVVARATRGFRLRGMGGLLRRPLLACCERDGSRWRLVVDRDDGGTGSVHRFVMELMVDDRWLDACVELLDRGSGKGGWFLAGVMVELATGCWSVEDSRGIVVVAMEEGGELSAVDGSPKGAARHRRPTADGCSSSQPLLDAVDMDKGEGVVVVASPDLAVSDRDRLRSKWIRNQPIFAVIMHGLDRSSAASPELSSPAAMAAGLEGEDGAPYGCSGGVLKTVYMQ